ncbi:hypothetical protein F5H01DRAFT_351709 [Linnemannia elongata]|nr:hypothetical protein F5H01DRAFT_351709 [Linnemannia elongata]
MLPQGGDPPTDQATSDSSAPSDKNTLHPVHHQQQEQEQPSTPSPTAATPLVKAITTTLSPLEDIPLTFCNRPPLSFRFPSPGSPGAEHDETIIRMMDNEQSWGDIEALAGEEAFDRYYSFLDPGLEEFWTLDKIEQLNDAVMDHVGRFLKPRAVTILKGAQHHHQQSHSENNNYNNNNNGDSEGEDVKKVATIYPVVVMSAWMDLCRWEKVARSVSSSSLVCQHIWETFGDGRPFTEEEQPFLDEIKATAIENGARISAIKGAAARVEAAKAKAAQEEADRLEAQRLEAARIKAAKEEEERIEAAAIKAAQDEADRIEAERLETEKIEAAEAEAKRVVARKIKATKRKAKADAAREEAEKESEEIEAKRVEAKKINAMKRKAKVDAAREEVEKEAKASKVAKNKKPGESRAAKALAVRQQNTLMQENIAKEETAREEVTRRQPAKEVNEDTLGTSKAKRETALAAAKAWEIAVREMAARKAEIQSAATKRQGNVSRGQAGSNRDQDLPLSPGGSLGSKRKIGNIEVFLPSTTLNSTATGNAAIIAADQENRPPKQDAIVPPPRLRSSTSSISCSSLISPAPSPLDESFDFQLSKRTRRCSSPENLCDPIVTSTKTKPTTPTPTTAIKSTASTTLPPAPLLSVNHNTTPKAPSFTVPSLPPTSLPQDAEAQVRIQKLTMMKKILTDCRQSMELQRQDQRVETDMLLRQRDAAIEAAKARQRGGSNNTTSHHENNGTKASRDPPEGRIPASSNSPQESTQVLTGLPSPVTPNQPPVSLSPELPAAARKTPSPPVIDLTEDVDHGLSIATSATHQKPPSQQDHRPQLQLSFLQQQPNSQRIFQAQQRYQQPQYLVQQHLQKGKQKQQPFLQHPQPTKSLDRPAQSALSSFPQISPNDQQMQEFLQEQVRKSPELHKLQQRHVLEKEQLLRQQQLDRQRLAQEQRLVTDQHQVNQQHGDEQLRLEAVKKWEQQEQAWIKRMQEIRQQEQVLGPKLASLRQQNQQLQETIHIEQKQWQQRPTATPEQIKQLHTTQTKQLVSSQLQRYTALHFVPVAQQAQAMANLHRLYRAEAQALIVQQKDAEEKMRQYLNRQEESKKVVHWHQLQLFQVQESERAVRKQLEGLHAQKLEQERWRAVLLQAYQMLQKGLQMIPAPSSSSSLPQGHMAGQGTTPVNLATSQQQQQQDQSLKYAMAEQMRQQLSQQRDIQRKQQLQEQVDLQQAQKNDLLQQARTIAEVQFQGLAQTTSQGQLGQLWSGVQAQQQQQQQAPTIKVQELQVSKDGQLAPVSPPLQTLATSQPPEQPTPTSQPSQPTTSGTSSTSAPPTTQYQQPSPQSTTAASKLAVIFPFPNPLYDITEWTAEDKNRLWTTWLEVGDDWEQISTKGLRGKFSVEACRAVILGTAS